jgi:hypothetical protein
MEPRQPSSDADASPLICVEESSNQAAIEDARQECPHTTAEEKDSERETDIHVSDCRSVNREKIRPPSFVLNL